MLALLPDPPSRAAWRALGTGPCSVFGGVGLSSETVRVSTSEMVVVFFHQVRTGARTPGHCRPVSTQCVVTRVIDGLTTPPTASQKLTLRDFPREFKTLLRSSKRFRNRRVAQGAKVIQGTPCLKV
jgi:hypothetical protein